MSTVAFLQEVRGKSFSSAIWHWRYAIIAEVVSTFLRPCREAVVEYFPRQYVSFFGGGANSVLFSGAPDWLPRIFFMLPFSHKYSCTCLFEAFSISSTYLILFCVAWLNPSNTATDKHTHAVGMNARHSRRAPSREWPSQYHLANVR